MVEYNIRLNPNCASAVHTGLKFKSGDKGIIFIITVDELDTKDTTAKIVFQRANGTSVENDITVTNGVYSYKTLGTEFAVPGKTVADLKFYASADRVSTASFVFEVTNDTMDGLGAGAGGYSDRLEQLVTEAEAAAELTAQARIGMEAAEIEMKTVKEELEQITEEAETAKLLTAQAKAKLEIAESDMQTVKTELEVLMTETEEAGTQTEQAKVELKAAEVSMQETKVELEQMVAELETAESNMKATEEEMENVLQNFKDQYGEVGALNPRGEWNSSATYQIRDVVYYGGFSWTALVENIGVTPSETNASTWTKHMDMSGIETKIDNIQTTSRATLSQAGWYRVAEYAKGRMYYNFEFALVSGYSATGAVSGTFKIKRVSSKYEITLDGVISSGTSPFTKVRLTKDSVNEYLEVYYAIDASNPVTFSILNPLDAVGTNLIAWKTLDPVVATSETVDGVTVTTTYDIPANASPVTDLDIAEAMEEFTYPVHKVATQEEFDALVESFHTNAQDDSYYRHFIYSSLASIVPVAGGMSVIEGCRQSANSGTQHVYRRKSSTANKYDGYKRGRTDGVWGEWGREIFEHDLVNALVRANGTETLKTSILEKALTLDNGTHEFMLGGSSYTGEDLPHILYAYGTATVHKWYGNIVVELHGHKNTATNRKAVKYYTEDNGTWSDWFIGVTTADLANYLSLHGGTLDNSLYIRRTDVLKYIAYYLENPLRKMELGITTSGVIKLHDTTNGKDVLKSELGGTSTFYGHSTEDLPLDGGGTVQKASALPLGIKNTSGTTCFMPIYGKDGILGFLGMNGQDTPVFMTSDQKSAKKLLHEGNYNDYALPLDGSVPMTGSELLTYNGYGRIVTTEGLMQLESKNAIGSTNNRRFLLIYNSTKEPLTRALRFSEVANGVQQTYDIHHDGNSAKVFQGASAPSDTKALWVDTVNKKVKFYIDGAWTAVS